MPYPDRTAKPCLSCSRTSDRGQRQCPCIPKAEAHRSRGQEDLSRRPGSENQFSKTFETFFFPVGKEIEEIVVDWVNYLCNEKLWGNDDPLFPATQVAVGEEYRFQVVGLERKHWSNATPIRKIFREAFEAAGLPYFNPHSMRSTLVQLGEKCCRTPEEFKAWSQNLGHEEVLTTFRSYGAVGTRRQGEIIQQLANPQERESPSAEEIAKAVARELGSQSAFAKP